MKVIKMKVHRFDPGNGGTRYEYPSGYDAKKVVMGPWYEKGAKQRGGNWQIIVFGVRDNDAQQFLNAGGLEVTAKDNPGQKFKFEAQELTRTEAEAEVTPWLAEGETIDQGVEFIEDQLEVTKTLVKIGRGQSLSQKEKDSLDPDKPERGIGRKKSVKEKWDEKFNKF